MCVITVVLGHVFSPSDAQLAQLMTACPLAAVVGCSTWFRICHGTATNFAAGFSGVHFFRINRNAILAGGVILIIQLVSAGQKSVRCELLVPVRRYCQSYLFDFSDYPFSTDWHHAGGRSGNIMAILLALAPVMLVQDKMGVLPRCVAVCG